MTGSSKRLAAIAGILGLAALAIILQRTWENPREATADAPSEYSTPEQSKAAFHPYRPQRKSRAAADGRNENSALETRLGGLIQAGNLTAVHDELEKLAEAGELPSIRHLLESWCREGSLELCQWVLMMSSEKEPDLHLRLCAEALSNPSEAMREMAATDLEEVSGIRFTDTLHAHSWLAGRQAAPAR